LLAGTAQATAVTSTEPAYSAYVQGRHAAADGELGRAADYFRNALSSAPDDPELLRQTFNLAIAAGDEPLAVSVARRLSVQDRFDSGVTLMLVADALKHHEWKEAAAATQRLSDVGFGSFIVPIIQAWTLEARGKTGKAVKLLDPASLDGFAKSYVIEHRAHLLMLDKKYDEAAALYDELLQGDEGRNARIRIAAATALQAAHRPQEALQRLEHSASYPDLERAKADLMAGRPIEGTPEDANAGIALLALRMAADLSRERAVPVALTLSRIATMMEPEDPTGWLLTSELLARAEKYEGALKAVRHVPDDSPSAAVARAQEAAILARLNRTPEALSLLEKAAHAPEAGSDDWARYGDALQAMSRFNDAAEAFRKAIALDPGGASDWRLHFLLGSSLEQAGNWQAAEPELRTALKLAPEEATVLNYLGYALLDRGLAPVESRKLIEKAHALQPQDGFITDSLGWAQYRSGEYQAAVATLERAIADIPDDPVVSEHLGDAYWKVGRHLEARYRWKAAMLAEPKPEQLQRLKHKADFGMDIGLAAVRKEPVRRP
jgi:Flp pilus assembly protein TadD